jgi:hypothetical protein
MGCICPSIPSRLRGVRAVRANAAAALNSRVEGGKWTWLCNGAGAGTVWTDRGEMRRVGAAYRTISRLDDRLGENAEDAQDAWAGAGQDYYYVLLRMDVQADLCWTTTAAGMVAYLWSFLRVRLG